MPEQTPLRPVPPLATAAVPGPEQVACRQRTTEEWRGVAIAELRRERNATLSRIAEMKAFTEEAERAEELVFGDPPVPVPDDGAPCTLAGGNVVSSCFCTGRAGCVSPRGGDDA